MVYRDVNNKVDFIALIIQVALHFIHVRINVNYFENRTEDTSML